MDSALWRFGVLVRSDNMPAGSQWLVEKWTGVRICSPIEWYRSLWSQNVEWSTYNHLTNDRYISSSSSFLIFASRPLSLTLHRSFGLIAVGDWPPPSPGVSVVQLVLAPIHVSGIHCTSSL